MARVELDDVLQKIEDYKSAWCEFIPENEFDWFVDRVKSAIKIYYELPDPAELSAELKKIEKASRRPSREFVNLINNASSTTRKVLEEHGGRLATPDPDDDEAITELAIEIRSRIIVASYWRPEGKKRRWRVRVTASLPFKRPKRRRLEVLVSLVSAAYSGASGKPTRRAWDLEDPQPIEAIIKDVISALEIDDNTSVAGALRRHVENRNRLNQNN